MTRNYRKAVSRQARRNQAGQRPNIAACLREVAGKGKGPGKVEKRKPKK